jgi:hypothetical protein
MLKNQDQNEIKDQSKRSALISEISGKFANSLFDFGFSPCLRASVVGFGFAFDFGFPLRP